MKVLLDLPDRTARRASAVAGAAGISRAQLIREAVEREIASRLDQALGILDPEEAS